MGKIGKIEELPGDLLAAIVLAVATLLFTLLPPFSDTPVRVPLGLLMVLFVPGYTLIAALFPRKGDLDGIERVALSFGLSIAVVPLMGLGLNYTPWGIRLTPMVVSISLFTLIMSAISYIRRTSLPADERFSVQFRKGLDSVKAEVMADEKSRLDKALTIILIISIIISITALVYVIVTPKQGEKFTEFYILGPNGKAYDYPTKVIAGNKSTVIVGVVNHEYSNISYTMNLNFDNTTILTRKIVLEHNQTWENPVTYVLNHTGDEQKLEFLLYKENNFTAPYRDLHLWVNVSSSKENFTRAFTGLSRNTIRETNPKQNIIPISLPLDDGSGSDGDYSNDRLSIRSNGSQKAEMRKVENTTNAIFTSALEGSSANISDLSEGNRSEALQGTDVNVSQNQIANVTITSGRQNKSIKSDISNASVPNASYNATNKSKPPVIQASSKVNLVPIQLGNKTQKKPIRLG